MNNHLINTASENTTRTTPMKLSELMKQASMAQHQEAENSSLMVKMFRGQMSMAEYHAYLLSLEQVYAAMEKAAEVHTHAEWLKPFELKPLFRLDAIKRDVRALESHMGGERLLTSAQQAAEASKAYTSRLERLTKEASLAHRLVAHFYVRYLGDLSGGQMLAGQLMKAGFTKEMLHFYDFSPLLPGPAKKQFRDALDLLGEQHPHWVTQWVEETQIAFGLNGDLFARLETALLP